MAREIKIYAHRGAKNAAPENSFAALELAEIVGASHIEFDVQLTRDEQLVIIHDEQLARTTGLPGQVCDKNFTALTAMDVGSWFSSSFSGEKMPGFIAWMDAIVASTLTPNIELKLNGGSEIILAKQVAGYLANQWPVGRELRVSSFDFDALIAIREAGYKGDIALLATSYDKKHVALLEELKACAYHVNYRGIKAEEIAGINEKGYSVLGYTINTVQEAKAFVSAGGEGFFTNNLFLLDACG